MVDTAVSVALIASFGLGILMHDDTKETMRWNEGETIWKERNLLEIC